MRFLVAIFLVGVTGCLCNPLFDSKLDSYWVAYQKNHGKLYASQAEEHMRRLIWENNLAYIQKHNLEADLGMHTHKLGINEHADLTDDEYTTYLKGFVMTNKTDAPLFMAPENYQIPEEVDWREKGYVTPVKNQARCGSCWAFSTTGSLEGQHFKKTGNLVSLSEQNLIDCSKANKGCHGGSMDAAFKYIRMNGGLDTEASYPYTAKDGRCHFMRSDIGATDSGYHDIPHMDEMALAQAVATVGPISVAIDASKKDFRFYKTGVYTSMECSSRHLDHGVLVVGYGSEMEDDYWIVKNSWGTSWGDRGYVKMRRNHHNMCGIATMASYPTV